MDAKQLLAGQLEFFLSGGTRSPAFRRESLLRLRRVLTDNQEAFIEALASDLGKPRMEAVTAELGFCVQEIDTTIPQLGRVFQNSRRGTPFLLWPGRSYATREPYGPTLILGPWNYPLNLTLVPVIGALAAGNTVVLKPSELAPHTADVLAKTLNAAFGPQVLRVVTGGPDTAKELLDLDFRFVFFTGSSAVGRKIAASLAPRLIPCILELGGKNPCVVEPGLPLRLVAQRIAFGKFYNAGQTCVAPDSVLVHSSLFAELTDELKRVIGDFFGADPSSSPSFGRIINDTHFQRLEALLKGSEILSGGNNKPAERYFAPTLVTVRDQSSPLLTQEIFGPVLPILPYKDKHELGLLLKNFPSPLALYAFSLDKDFFRRLRLSYPAGSYVLNDVFTHILNRELPFGGVGASGVGSYRGREGWKAFTRPSSLMERSPQWELPLRLPPYRDSVTRMIQKGSLK